MKVYADTRTGEFISRAADVASRTGDTPQSLARNWCELTFVGTSALLSALHLSAEKAGQMFFALIDNACFQEEPEGHFIADLKDVGSTLALTATLVGAVVIGLLYMPVYDRLNTNIAPWNPPAAPSPESGSSSSNSFVNV